MTVYWNSFAKSKRWLDIPTTEAIERNQLPQDAREQFVKDTNYLQDFIMLAHQVKTMAERFGSHYDVGRMRRISKVLLKCEKQYARLQKAGDFHADQKRKQRK